MDITTLIDICKAYSDLGSAVQEQIGTVLDGRPEDCNPNALRQIRIFFERIEHWDGADDIDTAIGLLDDAAFSGEEDHS